MKSKEVLDFLRSLVPHNKPTQSEGVVTTETRKKLEKNVFQGYLQTFTEKEIELREDMAIRAEQQLGIRMTDRSWEGIKNALDCLFMETYLKEIAPEHIRELPYKEQIMNCLEHQNDSVHKRTLQLMAQNLGLDAEMLEAILKLTH